MHRYPSCLSFELSINEDNQLLLAIRFGEQSFDTSHGKIFWGLKAGTLKLKLANATLPLSNINDEIICELELSYGLEEQNEEVSEDEINAAIPLNLLAKKKETSKKSTKISYKNYLIDSGGSQTEPTWIFKTSSYKSILQGISSNLLLGTLDVTNKPILILATFEARHEDVQLTTANGFWDRNIGYNWRAWIEREFFLRHIGQQIQPYLSQIEVKYD
jgi:hypothetical protein